jgi:tetratricopeptide (TPR) repeat protein
VKIKILISLFVIPLVLLADTKEKEADNLFRHHKYEQALTYYKELLAEDSSKVDLYFKIGLCYYNMPEQDNRATLNFETYLQYTDSVYEAYYLLGKLYHKAYRFDEAMQKYREYLQKAENDPEISDKILHEIENKIERELQYAQNGLALINNPKSVSIENLGADINTEYNEYGAVFSNGEKILVYTARYPQNNKMDETGDYYEDIYYVTLEQGELFDNITADTIETEDGIEIITSFKFSEPKKFRKGINTPKHDAAIQLTQDGKKLYIFREGDIWVTQKNDTGWTDPIEIEDNTKYFEPSIFISANEQIKIISSEREGSYGGLDLFWSKKNENGQWEPFKNMGPKINTPFNEDSPFLSFNDSTLYFSSTGHNSMGDYDVFKSTLTDSGWTEPVNLGFPINSPSNDIFYFTNDTEDKAYFSSDRTGGYGKMDIYRLDYKDTTSGFITVIDTSYDYQELPLDSNYIKQLLVDDFEEILRIWGDETMEDLVYKVQIAAFKIPKNFKSDHFKDLGKIERLRLDGITRFMIGEFKTLNEAYKFRNQVREKGINDAFIVAIYKGRRVYLEDLILSKFKSNKLKLKN